MPASPNTNRSSSVPSVTCYCDTDWLHSSYAVTGLIELADAGEIELRFRHRDRALSRRRYPWTLWLRVANSTQEAGVCIDTHDKQNYVCPHSLAACRYYYKSNFNQETLAAQPAFHDRLRPFGPYLPCRPRHDRALWQRRWGNLAAKFWLRCVHTPDRTPWQRFRKYSWEWTRHKRYLSRGLWTEYESPPTSSVAAKADAPSVFFNPSCWDEAEHPSLVALNEFRARLIVALRETLGSRFCGGFRRIGPSWAKYPQAVEERSYTHEEYVRWTQRTPVAVYTNGKWGCFSWRLPENFAAGQAIVSEPPVNDLGFRFDDSIGTSVCNAPEAMAAEVDRLLHAPEELQERRRRSFQFYAEQLRPQVRMRRLLAEVIGSNAATKTSQPLAPPPKP